MVVPDHFDSLLKTDVSKCYAEINMVGGHSTLLRL